MAQLDIYESQSEGVEFLLDLQDNMLEYLSTRVVAAPSEPVGSATTHSHEIIGSLDLLCTGI